jgi:hypothetical protein
MEDYTGDDGLVVADHEPVHAGPRVEDLRRIAELEAERDHLAAQVVEVVAQRQELRATIERVRGLLHPPDLPYLHLWELRAALEPQHSSGDVDSDE